MPSVDEDDLLEGFDLPAGLDDLPSLPTDPAAELAQMLGGDGTELDGRMEVQRPYFDPDSAAVQKFAVTGDTYPIKDQLKRLGCRWNGEVWIAPDEMTYKQACLIRNAQHRKKLSQQANPRQQQLHARHVPPAPAAYVPPPAAAPAPAKPKRTRIKAPEMSVDACIAGMDAVMGARQKGDPRPEPFDHNVEVDEQRRRSQLGQVRSMLKKATDAQLAEELEARGFAVAKRSERSLVAEAAAREGLSLEDADAAFEELS